MAANSLLYLLLSTGLTVSPDHSVTTESSFDQYTRRPSYGLAEDVAQWQERTRWPGYAEKQQDAWKEDTEKPFDQFTAPPVTEQNAEIIWPLATEEPVNSVESRRNWPLVTEKPVNIAESHWEPLATEEPVNNAESHWEPLATEEPVNNAESHWEPLATEEPVNNAESHWEPLATEEPVNNAESHWEPLATEEPVNNAESHWEPLATEEPVNNAESHWEPLATEEPERPQSSLVKKGPFSCHQNERYERCGTNCPQTCFETQPCPSNCCVEGCFCNRGLVRGPAGKCIKPEDCPTNTKDGKGRRKCPRREHYTRCHKNCEKTCENYKKIPPICPADCKPGCVCDGGLVRNKEGKCVMRQQCEKHQRAIDDDSHGCPYEFACDVYCVTEKRQKRGRCEGNTCKCYDR